MADSDVALLSGSVSCEAADTHLPIILLRPASPATAPDQLTTGVTPQRRPCRRRPPPCRRFVRNNPPSTAGLAISAPKPPPFAAHHFAHHRAHHTALAQIPNQHSRSCASTHGRAEKQANACTSSAGLRPNASRGAMYGQSSIARFSRNLQPRIQCGRP